MIGIYSNPHRDKGLKVAGKFIRLLEAAGIDYKTVDFCENYSVRNKDAAPQRDCGLIVVFGGDGTILGAASGVGAGIPLLGVNMGKLGFLADASEDGLADVVNALKNRAYTVEERVMIEAAVGGEAFSALNEIVVKGDGTHMAHLRLSIDGGLFDEYDSDGVLVATPTGSTAYSLSAGGPILAPDVNAFIINPISPHTLHSRPFVLSDSRTVRVETTKGETLSIIADGVLKAAVGVNGFVLIRKSAIRAKFARIKPYDFYSKVLNKFNTK